MAQPMTGRESAPLLRSNRPVSIFAEETTMTARTKTPKTPEKAQAETTPVLPTAEAVETPAAPVVAASATPVAAKPAPKPAKAPKVDPISHAQVARLTRFYVGQGLTEEAAIDEVLTTIRSHVRSILAEAGERNLTDAAKAHFAA